MSDLFQRLAGTDPSPGPVLPRPVLRHERPAVPGHVGSGQAEAEEGLALPEARSDTIRDAVDSATQRPAITAPLAEDRRNTIGPTASFRQVEPGLDTIRVAPTAQAPGSERPINHAAAVGTGESSVMVVHTNGPAPHAREADGPRELIPSGPHATPLAVRAAIPPRENNRGKPPDGKIEKPPTVIRPRAVDKGPDTPVNERAPVHAPAAPAKAEAPIIEVTIGRIEVRTPQAPQRSAPPPHFRPVMSLDDYLQRRNKGSR